MDVDRQIEEDLMIEVGIGATMSVGSDCYPYYISETLPNNVLGLYQPAARFDETHPWEGGTQVVDEFDRNHPTELYIKRTYGKWWNCDKNGKRLTRFTSKWIKFDIGHAYAYQNPSF